MKVLRMVYNQLKLDIYEALVAGDFDVPFSAKSKGELAVAVEFDIDDSALWSF